ncbi:hypothetical protein PIB30_048512 [Stylosanthes scabra]|uniref:Uncharacterized protein n=1 Tax=Stylosanthes scabra TaxID=79078 RepID=A0ABU6WH58_9FABA|nr:hypothetical protein [Stylosanthes scabra]
MVYSLKRGPLQQQVLDKVLKRTDSGAQSLEPTGGGPARPLRRSSQQNALRMECTASAIVRIIDDRIPNGYFDGSVKQKLDSATWLVAGWLTSSLQKEISADCKEVTKASG